MAAIFSRPQCVNKRGSRYLESLYIWPTYRHWYVHRLALEILRPKKTCRLVQTTVWKKIHSCKKTFQFELFDLLQEPRSVKCVSFCSNMLLLKDEFTRIRSLVVLNEQPLWSKIISWWNFSGSILSCITDNKFRAENLSVYSVRTKWIPGGYFYVQYCLDVTYQ